MFFSSVYPTISSGKNTKDDYSINTHGMNMFYKLWTDANNKQNDYVQLKFIGQKFKVEMKNGKKKQLEIHPTEQFQSEFECEFLGSIDTLIAPSKIKTTHIRN